MRNQTMLSLLLCGLMLYYAIPRLAVDVNSAQGFFSLSWLFLALLVTGGNLSSLLYNSKKFAQQRQIAKYPSRQGERKRMTERG
ncbi:hypothetical protein [Priestia abyssalis]|uniref:hypothetical protein n=1 Tax=Priestia abyssalis TaxID=1221450 RepID=UPI0009949073|nr:hypothetical protein [Priestia abyssalis]